MARRRAPVPLARWLARCRALGLPSVRPCGEGGSGRRAHGWLRELPCSWSFACAALCVIVRARASFRRVGGVPFLSAVLALAYVTRHVASLPCAGWPSYLRLSSGCGPPLRERWRPASCRRWLVRSRLCASRMFAPACVGPLRESPQGRVLCVRVRVSLVRGVCLGARPRCTRGAQGGWRCPRAYLALFAIAARWLVWCLVRAHHACPSESGVVGRLPGASSGARFVELAAVAASASSSHVIPADRMPRRRAASMCPPLSLSGGCEISSDPCSACASASSAASPARSPACDGVS